MTENTISSIFKKEPQFTFEHLDNKIIDRFIKENTGIYHALHLLEEYYVIDSEEVAEAYLITLLSVERLTTSKDLSDRYNSMAIINLNSTPYIAKIHKTHERIQEAIRLVGEVNITLE